MIVISLPHTLCGQGTPSQTTPVFAEKLLFAPPNGFQNASHSERVGSLSEFVPRGETVEDWTQMITVQVFRGLKVEPADFLQTIGKRIAMRCPGFNSPNGIITGDVNGYTVSMLTVKCPLNPVSGKPESTIYRIIKGKDALYSVQHAWRSVPPDKDLGDGMFALRKAFVCDSQDPRHPCPSSDVLLPNSSKPKP